ncbi:MAG: hypothetical protein ACO1TE_11515 [Prosthecobacter sp.]
MQDDLCGDDDRSRAHARVRVQTRRVVAVLLILGAMVALYFQLAFAWGFTDSANWGAWGKPQTPAEHGGKFLTFLVRWSRWPVLASIASLIAGVLLWPRRKGTMPPKTTAVPGA